MLHDSHRRCWTLLPLSNEQLPHSLQQSEVCCCDNSSILGTHMRDRSFLGWHFKSSTHRGKLLSWSHSLKPHVARIGSLVWNYLLARITCHIYHVYMNVWDTEVEVSYCPRVNSKPGHYCAKRVLVTEIRCNVRENVRSRKICSKIFRVEKFVESFQLGRKIELIEILGRDKKILSE